MVVSRFGLMLVCYSRGFCGFESLDDDMMMIMTMVVILVAMAMMTMVVMPSQET